MLQVNSDTQNLCLNCGTPLQGEFCHVCGQKRIRPYKSFPYLLKELLGSYFNFDSALVDTLKLLITRPGFLTTEYAAGKRIQYIHPIRLYVFTSLIFFIVFIPVTESRNLNGSVSIATSNGESLPGVVDSISLSDSIFLFNTSYPLRDTREAMQAYLDSLPDGQRPGYMAKAFLFKTIELNNKPMEDVNREFVSAFLKNLPKMLFFLLPIYALLLNAFYWRRQLYLEEHLVYTLHLHIFLFILILILLFLALISGWFWLLLVFIGFAYMLQSQRVVFRQKKRWILLKTVLILMCYALVISIVSILNVVYSFLTY